MEDEVYQTVLSHAKENPFKSYLEFLLELGELTEEEEELCQGIGKEFIGLLENTNMSKVYKMPVLLAFYNHGEIRMEVTEEQLLKSWKEFFSTGTNWKDLEKDISYDRYLAVSDKEHLRKILKMPVHFLLESGKGFFVQSDEVVLALYGLQA